ncbi:MAG: hypothetical protein PHQ54_01300 [Candidatus Omnitrophica bacterium]|nr:hypothetical protein [Candidatus Omnitrophota bacterium]
MKLCKYAISIIFIGLFFISLFAVKISLNNKVIGRFDRSGLYGEIVMEENVFYNFKNGNVLEFFKTDFFNYPVGENLGFRLANSFHLFLSIPLKIFLNPIESYNALVIIIFLLNFLSAYILAKYLFYSKSIALCSALIFAMNSYVFLKMNLGFNQKISLFWIPLYCLFLFKLQNAKKWCYVFGAGFTLTLMQLTYPPYAYFAIIFTFVLSAYSLLKPKELCFVFSRFISMLLFYFAVSSLIYYLMGFGFVYLKPYQVDFNITLDGSLDLMRPFRFFPYHSPGFPTELPLGISISAFLLGIIAFIKNRGLARLMMLIFIFFCIIAAGPYLVHNGNLIYIWGRKIILPFYFMDRYLPFIKGIFYPVRVFPFINICLAISAGYGLLHLSSAFRKFRILAFVILFPIIYISEQILIFPQLFPPKLSDVYVPQFYQEIKNKESILILNLPYTNKRKVINRYGFYAVLSNAKIVNSFVKNELPVYLPENSDSEQLKKEFMSFLNGREVDYVVVHEYFLAEEAYKEPMGQYSWLKEFCYFWRYPEDGIVVYQMLPVENSILQVMSR